MQEDPLTFNPDDLTPQRDSFGERLQTLAGEVEAALREVRRAEEQLRLAKEQLHELQRVRAPELLKELGVMSVELPNGITANMKQDADVSIPADQKDAAYTWMKAHGFSGLWNTKLVAEFNNDDVDRATKELARLHELGSDAVLQRAIHTNRLKAWVREQLEAGNALPQNIIRIHPYDWVKFDPPKK